MAVIKLSNIMEKLGWIVLVVVAGALLPILLWRNQSPWSTLTGCVVLGAAGGIVIGWIRRPTRLAAAVLGIVVLAWAGIRSSRTGHERRLELRKAQATLAA